MSDALGPPPDWRRITSVESLPLLGGPARVRVRLTSPQGLLLEIAYSAGTESPEHTHQHDSYLYLLGGHLVTTLDGQITELMPGDALLQPAGTPHGVRAIRDSHWLEFKSPPMVVWQ